MKNKTEMPERRTKEYSELVHQYIKDGIEGKLGVEKMKKMFKVSPSFVHDVLCKYILEIQPCQSNRYAEEEDADICAYRGVTTSFLISGERIRTENRCAVGLFISDIEYRKRYENNDLGMVLYHTLEEPLMNYAILLRIWQTIHDITNIDYINHYVGILKSLYEIKIITDPTKKYDNYNPYEG